MKFIKKISIILVCLFLVNNVSKAATGCIATVGIIFQPAPGTRLYTSLNNGVVYNLFGSSIDNPYSTYCITATGGSCTLQGILSYQGIIVDYNLPAGCAVDDYVTYLLLLTGVLGIFKLKTRNISLLN